MENDPHGGKPGAVKFPDVMKDFAVIKDLASQVQRWIRRWGMEGRIDPMDVLSELAIYVASHPSARESLLAEESPDELVLQLQKLLWYRFMTLRQQQWRTQRREKNWTYLDHHSLSNEAEYRQPAIDRLAATPAPDYIGDIEAGTTNTNSQIPFLDPTAQRFLHTFRVLLQEGRIKNGVDAVLFDAVCTDWLQAGAEDKHFNTTAVRHINQRQDLTEKQRESLRKKLHRWLGQVSVRIALVDIGTKYA